MSRPELNGYKPLRPWERLFAYVSFVVTIMLAFVQAHFDGVSLSLAVYTSAMILAFVCALIAFLDARMTARLRRSERMQQQQMRPAIQKFEAQFSSATGDWSYFEDSAPTTH